ncbi:MAG: tripartite tricarboxylate transporter permease [Clostridiales bacterium]|nr:tripartite tricarboxylate transporter permease [Clostridiales bacterium]
MLAEVISTVFSPMALLINLLGVVLGIIFGAMPGLNGVVGVALLLPLTYGLSPSLGLIMLSGLYMGATYGGSISAILLNCPGTGEAACTALNGSPLARQGRAKEALSYSVLASGFGGVFGVVIMMLFTPFLSQAALKFGPPELFLVCLGGLAVVGSLMGKSFSKGFISVAIGLVLSIVGMDAVSANYRFTFDNVNLQAGFDLIPVSVGLFAIAEMLNLICNQGDNSVISGKNHPFPVLEGIRGVAKRWKLLIKSSIIGTIIGILPGTGGAIASFISYGEAKRTSKEASQFGKGAIDGIVAPESANNAAVGGSFVPLLALGIPGSATSAIIFGALTVHGMIPGPKLFSEHADVVYSLMLGLLVSTILMVVIGLLATPAFSKVLSVDIKLIIPAVLTFSIFGAYSARNSLFDVLVAVVFGLIGLVFKRFQIPIAPAVLGMILGSMAEKNLRRSLTIAAAKNSNIVSYILFRPISLVILILLILLVYGNFKTALRKKNEE